MVLENWSTNERKKNQSIKIKTIILSVNFLFFSLERIKEDHDDNDDATW